MNIKTVLAFSFTILLLGSFPMAFGQSVTVSDCTSTFEEWDNSDWYDGVIENMGETTAVFPEITISYYDKEHSLIHSTTTSAEISYLGPGEKTPFTIIVDHMNFTTLEFSIDSSSMDSLPYRDFTINEASRGTDSWGLNTITYDVTNTGKIDLDSITLYGIHFDTNGDFLDYSMSYLVEELASGETVSIEIDMIPLETADTYVIIDVLEIQPETQTGSDTTTSNPTSNTDAEPDSGGGIPGFPIYSLLLGMLSVTYLFRREIIS